VLCVQRHHDFENNLMNEASKYKEAGSCSRRRPGAVKVCAIDDPARQIVRVYTRENTAEHSNTAADQQQFCNTHRATVLHHTRVLVTA
jgi:hypothetical protein